MKKKKYFQSEQAEMKYHLALLPNSQFQNTYEISKRVHLLL